MASTCLGVALRGPAATPLPALLTARTSKAYSVPLVRPVTTTCVSSAVLASRSMLSGTSFQIAPPATVAPGEKRYWYLVMAAAKLPASAGSAHESVMRVSPCMAVKFCGAPGRTVALSLIEPLTAI